MKTMSHSKPFAYRTNEYEMALLWSLTLLNTNQVVEKILIKRDSYLMNGSQCHRIFIVLPPSTKIFFLALK